MSNPLDKAFAKADRERALAVRMEREKDRARELAVGDLLAAYRELLEEVPRYVTEAPETIALAWLPETEPPSSVQAAGVGQERGSPLAFGFCEAWRFRLSNPEHKTRIEFFVAADCATVFMTEGFSRRMIKRTLRRAVYAEALGPFVDVRTGRHALRLDVSPGYGDQPYRLHRSDLLSPTKIAEIIASQAQARRR
jgi:hypothetical protein